MADDGLEEMLIIVFGLIFTESLWIKKKEKGLDEVVLFLVFRQLAFLMGIASFPVTINRVHVFVLGVPPT